MAGTRLKLNSSEIQSYLDGNHGVRAALQAEAEKVLSNAKANAPVLSGAYQSSLHIEEAHTDRLVLRVVADVPYAAAVEANDGTLARSL